MFDRNFHSVPWTEGEIYARFVLLTRLCLADGVLVAASKEAFRWRQENPTERIKPRRRGTDLSCPMRSTVISPGHFLFLSNVFGGASSSCYRNDQQTASGHFQRRARSKFGRKLPGPCNRFLAWSCDSLCHGSRIGKRTRAPSSRRCLWLSCGQRMPARTSGQRVALMWTWGVGLRQRCSSSSTHVQLECFNFLSFFFFELCQKLSSKFMINAILRQDPPWGYFSHLCS